MFSNYLSGGLRRACQITFVVALVAILLSSTQVLAEMALPNGSFEDDVVTSGNIMEQVPTDWRQTFGFSQVIEIYRPAEGDAFYGLIPDGDQAVLYRANLSQELQPGVDASTGTGITMEEGVTIALKFDAVFFNDVDVEGVKGIQIDTLVNGAVRSGNTQFFVPNLAVDGFGTFTYEYTPVAADDGENFGFWCYCTAGTPEFLVDNFRYEVAQVPEPGTIVLLIAGMATLLMWRRKK